MIENLCSPFRFIFGISAPQVKNLDNGKPKDLFDYFSDFFLGHAQIQFIFQLFLALTIYFLFQTVWHAIRPSIAEENDFRLSFEQIFIDSKPLWIPPTLQSDAIDNDPNLGSSDSLSLLEPKLAENLMNAFRAEPWIREVKSVRLEYPGEIFIDAQFREPVALVERYSVVKDGISSRAIYQVDSEGVLLPTDFLTASLSTDPNSIHDYLWIKGVSSTPVATYGQHWGDPVLYEAALLADFLRDSFKQLGIVRILIPDQDSKNNVAEEKLSAQRIWRLETAEGREIIWGAFPMSTVIRARSGSRTDYDAAKADAFRNEEPKLHRLIDLAKGGTLDEIDGEIFPIDLTKID